ncbi:UbiA family prenyltransferase [Candidatus Micrarchaeota archaeon]|nr:UbiA family prenyltransferase [Candidatus Micrarchaeota archaeon]
MNFMNTLNAWHRLFRSEHALIAFIGVLVGGLLVNRSFSPSLLFPAIGPALIVLAAFALNDYFGFETDKANKRRDRPIVSGEITRGQALVASFSLFAVGLALAYLVNFTVFVLSLVYVFLSIIYDPVLKKLPLIGHVFIALSMAGPFIYGNLAVTSSISISGLVFLLALIAFFAGIGRELLITLRDVEGDKKIGANTLPMILGPGKTVVLAAFFIALAIALSILPVLTFIYLLSNNFFSPASALYTFFIAITDFLMLFVIYKAVKSQRVDTLKQCGKLSLYALGTGVIAFLALAVLQ